MTKHEADLPGILYQIVAGDMDSYLSVIADAVADRQELISGTELSEVETGSTLRLNTMARPKYLVGAEVTYRGRTGSGNVIVEVMNSVGRFDKGEQLTLPAVALSRH